MSRENEVINLEPFVISKYGEDFCFYNFILSLKKNYKEGEKLYSYAIILSGNKKHEIIENIFKFIQKYFSNITKNIISKELSQNTYTIMVKADEDFMKRIKQSLLSIYDNNIIHYPINGLYNSVVKQYQATEQQNQLLDVSSSKDFPFEVLAPGLLHLCYKENLEVLGFNESSFSLKLFGYLKKEYLSESIISSLTNGEVVFRNGFEIRITNNEYLLLEKFYKSKNVSGEVTLYDSNKHNNIGVSKEGFKKSLTRLNNKLKYYEIKKVRKRNLWTLNEKIDI